MRAERIKRWAVPAALACAAVMAAPAAAPAAPIIIPRLTVTGKAYTVAGDSNTTKMVITCEAQGQVNVYSAVSIKACYTTNGGWAPLVSVPGETAVTSNVVEVTPGPYRVCAQAVATTLLGSQDVDTGVECRQSILGVGLTYGIV